MKYLLSILLITTSAWAQIQVVQDIALDSLQTPPQWDRLGQGNSGEVALWGTFSRWGLPAGHFAVFDTVSSEFVWHEVLREDSNDWSVATCLDVTNTDSAYLVQWSGLSLYDTAGGYFRVGYYAHDGSGHTTTQWSMISRIAVLGILHQDHAYFADLSPYGSFAPFGMVSAFNLGNSIPEWDVSVLPYMMDNWNVFYSMRMTSGHGIAITAMTGLPGDGATLLRLVSVDGQPGYLHYFAAWDSLYIFDALETAGSELWSIGMTAHTPRRLLIQRYEDNSSVFLPFFTNAAACTLDVVLAPNSGGILVSAHTENGAGLFRVGPQMNFLWSEEQVSGTYGRILDIIAHPDSGYVALALDGSLGQYHLVRLIETTVSAYEPAFLSPSSHSLSAYPNPFNSTTALSFTVPQSGYVTLRVFDLLGQEVETLLNGEMTAGEHTINYSPEHLGSGIYFARLETFATTITQKLVILK